MKTLLLLVLLAQRKEIMREVLPPDIDAAKEARQAETLVLENEVVRVFEVKVPKGLKELNFAPRYRRPTGEFFLVGGSRVLWLDGPLMIRGEALHVEFVQPITVKPVAIKEGVMFENSHVRVRHMGRGEGGDLRWLAKERVLLLKQGADRIRVELKF